MVSLKDPGGLWEWGGGLRLQICKFGDVIGFALLVVLSKMAFLLAIVACLTLIFISIAADVVAAVAA